MKALNNRARYLDEQWTNQNPDIQKGNVFAQTVAALNVLVDSYGTKGQIDVVNLRYVLTSCGEEMTDDEFDDALRLIGQSTKGNFNVKKMFDAYADLGRKQHTKRNSGLPGAENGAAKPSRDLAAPEPEA